MTRNVIRSIIVNVPPERAFAVLSDFKNFPRFMAPIERVEVDGRRLKWHATFDGQPAQWETEVVELSPCRRVAWHATSGRHHHVVITLRPLDHVQTEITLGAEYTADPHEHKQQSLRYETYLRAFKEFVERPRDGSWMTQPLDTPREFM
jgi:uncharacterized membrane protein